MKTKKTLTTVLLTIIGILCIAYYGYFIVYRSFTKDPTEGFSTKFKFGLVQTTTDEDLSYITYYDKDFNKVYSQKVKCGALGDTLDNPQTADSKVYFVPQDTANSKDNSKVVSINLTTGKKKTFDVGQKNITHYQADSDAIYTAGASNDEVILSRFVMDTKETKTLSLGKVTLDTLRVHNDRLFAFISVDGKNSVLVIDSANLTVVTTYPIDDFSGKVTATSMFGNSIFFTYEDAKNTKNPTGIGSLNLFDKKVATKPLTLAHASQIFHSGDNLIITADHSNKIAVYDTIDEKDQVYDLSNEPIQCTVTGDYLYSMDNSNLYVYNLSDFSVKKTVPLSLKDTKDAKFHYSSFFTKQ